MGYEIDYIPVGDGEKCGDAICLRFGNLFGSRREQTVVIIDGGFLDSGEKLVQHLRHYYGTSEVDLVVSTHPDADHASGLSVVLEKCDVNTLLMHRPWEHASDIKEFFKDRRTTISGLEKRIEKSLQNSSDLEDIAIDKGIYIIEPFQGVTRLSESLQVLGPSKDYYESLLPSFKSTSATKESFSTIFKKAAEVIVNWIDDNFYIDLLNDNEDTTSPENNTSAIILFTIDDQKFLFTGDAGKTGLLYASDYADKLGISLTDLDFLDVPHHGSKRNLSSNVLSKITAKTAFISAPKGSSKHPSKKITNALKKRGMKVFVNRGEILCYPCDGAPNRGWSLAQEEPFHSKVEE